MKAAVSRVSLDDAAVLRFQPFIDSQPQKLDISVTSPLNIQTVSVCPVQ